MTRGIIHSLTVSLLSRVRGASSASTPGSSGIRWNGRLRFWVDQVFALLLLGFLNSSVPKSWSQVTPEVAPFRIGFSTSTLGEMNQNDAIAAVRIWAEALRKDKGIPLDPQPVVMTALAEMKEALQSKQLDGLNLTTDEYRTLRSDLSKECVLLGVQGNSVEEEFVLLVHQASGITRLEDLRGRSLSLYLSPRMRLAPVWLATVVGKLGYGAPKAFWGRIASATKLTRAVLPVFFRQADACLATRRAFATLVEMNPQVGRDLRVLMQSPPFVPYLFAFRESDRSGLRQQIVEGIGSWHTTVAGRQILTMFQCDRLESHPVSILDPTLSLLEEQARYPAEEEASDDAVAPPPSSSAGRLGGPGPHLPQSGGPRR